MTSYSGRHAELYDIIYADKPYAAESEFVHQRLRKYCSGPVHRVLELACGTGRHALALERLGYEVVATDNSPSMLAQARRNAREASSSVRFEEQDMRDLRLGDAPFDGAICLFDSIGYVETNDALAAVLNGVHRHLRLGGVFVCEFWHAAAMLRAHEPLRIRRWPISGGELLRVSETELDVVGERALVSYTLIELREDGTYTQTRESQTNRYFLVQEMAGLLKASKLTPLQWFAGYSFETPITLDTWHILVVARKNEETGPN